MKAISTFLAALVLAGSGACHAYLVRGFPGLDKAIEESHSIAIIRIDEQTLPDGPDEICRVKCMICQCLKGDLKPNRWVTLRLRNYRSGGFVSPFQLWSTHLVFLSKQGDSYENINFEGSNLGLLPIGHEKMPQGETLREKIRTLMDATIAYRKERAKREEEFLKKVRG